MRTPELHRLVIDGETDRLERLLLAGRVDIDTADASGKTALMYAAEDPHTDTRLLELLLQHGARLELQSRGLYDAGRSAIGFAVSGGDPCKVALLAHAGASLHYRDTHGHDALLNAVHHRDVARDPRLLELLQLLIAHGVELNTVTDYQESGLRVLSRLGRFDAVKLLLEAGAAFEQLQWTALHRAVAMGSVAEMEQLLEAGCCSEDRDWWSRTPWLLAIMAGDVAKTQLLLNYGAVAEARGRCGTPPLSFAVMAGQPEMLRWLIATGADVQQTDDYGSTPLFEASECDQLECAAMLLAAGAEIDHRNHIPQTALANTRSATMTRLLLDIGADIRELSNEGRRHLLGFSRTPDFAALALISTAEFAHGRERRFGHHNPEIFAEPFWHAMIRSGATGYDATRTFAGPASFDGGPVWCAHRFGQSLTFLPNGCIVQIAGEHEDSYDPDFCIYNDVFLHEPDGRLTIYGYPESVFPPTDFHTATLLGQYIYLIGSAGYKGSRQYGRTPVYRLDIETFAIERLECSGAAPGWIYRHLAKLRSPYEIEITSGTLITSEGDTEQHAANTSSFVLDVRERTWWRV